MPIIAEASTLEWQGIIDALTTEFTVSSIASVLSLTIPTMKVIQELK